MKKIIISNMTLKSVLKRLKQVIPTKAVLPSLENIYVQVRQNATILVTATDLELTIQCETSCEYGTESEEQFEMLIPFDFLNKVCAVSGDAPMTIELQDADASKKSVEILTGNDYYCAGVMDELSDYPKIPAIPKKKFIELNGTFIETLNNAILSVSKDEFRPAMQNVCLDIQEKNITVASTDGNVLFSKKIADESLFNEQLLVSPKAAKALDGFTNAKVAWNEKFISFECDGITVISTRHNDQFPTWRAVIPSGWNSFLKVDKKTIQHALDKCNISDVDTKSTMFTMQETILSLESTSFEDGKVIKTEVDCEFTGEVANIVLNSKKLQTLISSVDSKTLSANPLLKMSLISHSKAVLITTEEDESFQLIIMPIQLN